MLDKLTVQGEINNLTEQYSKGLISKEEALEAMITVVDCAISTHSIENTVVQWREDITDYEKAQIILREFKSIEKFKASICFGDILQHRPL